MLRKTSLKALFGVKMNNVTLFSRSRLIFFVKSHTSTKKKYKVQYLRNSKRWECECKGFLFHNEMCSHLKDVWEWIKYNNINL